MHTAKHAKLNYANHDPELARNDLSQLVMKDELRDWESGFLWMTTVQATLNASTTRIFRVRDRWSPVKDRASIK